MSVEIKAAVLEDNETELDSLEKMLYEWGKASGIKLSISDYSSGEAFFEHNSGKNYNSFFFYLLDIKMGGMDGIEVAKRLRDEKCNRPIVFLSSFTEYAFNSYSVRAMNFLKKPVDKECLFSCLNEIKDSLIGDLFVYGSDKGTLYIPYGEILVFSGSNHNVEIMTEKATHVIYTTLGNIEKNLPTYFFKVHRSYIVNLAHIQIISGNKIIFTNRTSVNVARNYKSEFMKAFTKFTGRF